MYRLVMDLDNKIKVFICSDESLMEIKDFQYSADVLCEIMEIVQSYPIEESTIIVHSVFSKCMYKNACVLKQIGTQDNLFIGSMPIDDLNKLAKTFTGCKTRIIDITQYLFSHNYNNCCYIDTINGMSRVFVCDTSKCCVDHFICSQDHLDERLNEIRVKYGISEVHHVKDLGDVLDAMYFTNAGMLCDFNDESLIKDAALAAFAFELSDEECLDFTIIEQSTENIQKADKLPSDDKIILETSGEISDSVSAVMKEDNSKDIEDEVFTHTADFFMQNLAAQDTDKDDDLIDEEKPAPVITSRRNRINKKIDKPEVKVAKDNKKTPSRKVPAIKTGGKKAMIDKSNKKINSLENLVLITGIIAVLLIGAIFIVNSRYKSELENLTLTKTSIQNQISDTQNKISVYNTCLNLERNDLFKAVDVTTQEMVSSNGKLSNLVFRDNVSIATISFNSQEDVNKFIEQVNATHPEVMIGEPTQENTVEISIN